MNGFFSRRYCRMSDENSDLNTLPDLEEPTGLLAEALKEAVVDDDEINAIFAELDKGISKGLQAALDEVGDLNDPEINAIFAGLEEGEGEGEDEDDPNLKEALAASLAEAAPKATLAAPKAAPPPTEAAAAPKPASTATVAAAAPKAAAPPTEAAAPPTATAKEVAPPTEAAAAASKEAAPTATAKAAPPPTEAAAAAAPKEAAPTATAKAAPPPTEAAAAAPKEVAPTATAKAAPPPTEAAAAPREAPQPLAAAPRESLVAAPREAPMPGGGGSAAAAEAVAVKKARRSIQNPEDVEAIVAAFVEQNKVAWTTEWAAENPKLAAQHQTFLHKDESVTNGEVLSAELKNTLIPMEGFQLKYTSGTNNNCIVNALLTSLSPTFRRLGKKYKDRVSSYFRYEVLEKLYRTYFYSTTFETDEGRNTAVNIYREIASGIENYNADKTKTGTYYGGGFISVEVAGIFGQHFGINVLIKDRDERWLEERLEAAKGGKGETKTATKTATIVKERGSFTFLGPAPPVDRLIIIHNIDGAHYSSIAGPGNEYVFPIELVQDWLAVSKIQDLQGIQSACPFVEDQVLRTDYRIFIVLDSENNEKKPGCKHIYVYPLTKPMEVEEIKQLKKDLRNILSIEKVANGNEDKHGHLKLRANQAFEELKGTRYPRKVKTYTSPTDMFTDLKYWLEHAFINIIKDPEYRRNYTLAKPDPEDMTGYKTKYEYYLQNGGRDELLAIARKSVDLATAVPSPAAAGGGTTATAPAVRTAATPAPGGGTTAPTASSAKLAAAAREAAAKAAAATPAPTPTQQTKTHRVNPSVAERLAAAMAAQKLAATRNGTQKKTKEGKRKTRRK